MGDPGRLRQVLVQLVTNAIRFTPQGRIQVGAKLLAHDAGSATVRFAVRDTGIGIPSDQVELVFQPFSQANTGVQQAMSSGLGLSIAARVVERMGGRIGVESTEGKGSAFSFDLTFRRVQPEDDEAEAARLSQQWILVITDDARVGHNLTDALRHGGFEPTEFSSIPLAAASVALSDDPASLPGAVVLAPSDEPFYSAARLRADARLSKVPALLVVPHGVRGDAAECARVGIEGYLPQPASPVDLIEATRELLRRGRGSAGLVTRHWLRERRRPLRILVVDDSPTGRAVIIRSLERLGHETQAATTGREAVAMVDSRTFDVVLMDMEMPDMDGVEATAVIREKEQSGTRGHLPIVGVSAHAFGADRQRCLDAGMDDHVTKPFRIEQLQFVMERLVGSG
jgi:CheY-like chemotaxis protein